MIDISHKHANCKGAFHIAYYFPTSDIRHDQYSRAILSFKDGHAHYVDYWSNVAATAVSSLRVEAIVRALGSRETRASGSAPLDRLCATIAQRNGAQYKPEAIYKSQETQQLKMLGAAARRSELSGVYRAQAGVLDGFRSVLIVDDVTTSGATVNAITNAIKAVYPQIDVYFMALASTPWRDTAASNAHMPQIPPPAYATGTSSRRAGTSSNYQRPTPYRSPSVSTSSSNTSSSDACYIASCAYSDPHHPDVELLRYLRDRFFSSSQWGLKIIRLYYRNAPTVVKKLDGHPKVNYAIRGLLLRPIVKTMRRVMH